MRLQVRLFAFIAIIFLVHFAVVEYLDYRQSRAVAVESLLEQARALRGVLMATRRVYHHQFLDSGLPLNDKTLGFIPAYALKRISDDFRNWVDTGLSFNNVSDRPRNPENAADELELEAIRFFRENREAKERLIPFRNPQGEAFYHYTRPIWIESYCLKCHGRREDAPPTIRARYDAAYDYKLGDLRGILSIKLPAGIIEERVMGQMRARILNHLMALLLIFLVISWLLRRMVLTRVSTLKEAAARLSAGDYQARAAVSGNDEIAQVAAAFDAMADAVGEREQALRRQKNHYAALSETNHNLVRFRSPEALYKEVCRIAVEYVGLRLAWVALMEPQGEGMETVAMAVAAGDVLEQGGASAVPALPESRVLMKKAVRERRHIIVNDLPEVIVSGEGSARREGLAAAAAFPILPGGEAVGVFILYTGEAGFFAPDLIELLDEMVLDVTFVLEKLQREAERERVKAELECLNRRNQLLLESAGEGIYGIDDSGKATFVNQAALRMLGYSRDEIIGKDMHTLTHHTKPDGTPYPAAECPIYQTIMTGEGCRTTTELFWCKNGDSFPVEYSAYPIREVEAVTGAVVVFRDTTESHAMARKMDYLATHDSLTGLLNRYAFERHLEEALGHAREEDQQHALCYLDLDQFKVVNDTCGHIAGDELLRQLSGVLQHKVRRGDTLARLGGDEFGLLLEHCSLEQAAHLTQEICDLVRNHRFSWNERIFTVGVSIGVVEITAGTEGIASALSIADEACYLAKERGRNRVHVHQTGDRELAQRHGEMQWVSRIHEAFEQQRFYLERQTIMPIAAGGTQQDHFEILVRMRDEEGGSVPPSDFIPAAERYNLMPALDRWVIGATFEWLHADPLRLECVELCTINLSGHSLGDDRLLDYIVGQTERHDVPPEKICFEVTETAAVAHLGRAAGFITAMKKQGFRFALDDFGSGMSSFAYLKNLPVDFLKIDGSFVRDIVDDPTDFAMVEAINRVGHVMGIRTIAEFVENEAILEKLTRIGVDYAQGFGIARPAPLDP